MKVTLDIPDTLADRLTASGTDPARAVLESLAVEGYRTHLLSESEVRRMLGLDTRMEVHALLAAGNVPLRYTEEHLQQDIDASNRLAQQRTMAPARAA